MPLMFGGEPPAAVTSSGGTTKSCMPINWSPPVGDACARHCHECDKIITFIQLMGSRMAELHRN